MWGDINVVMGGGWPPSELREMSLNELCTWHAEARARNDAQNEALEG